MYHMQRLECLPHHIFVFDLEFIGDVQQLSTCQIWEIAVCSLQTNNIFEMVIDPHPETQLFPKPPIVEIPELTRSFLTKNNAVLWPVCFQKLMTWIQEQLVVSSAVPVFVSHNTFRADKPIMELECRRYNIRMPLHWYFFDSLHYSRSVIRNTTGNYSLSGLHEQLFHTPIVDVHRARADVFACMRILGHLTNNTWAMSGPTYPAYSTSLRSIRWIGRKAEEILCNTGITSVEALWLYIQTNVKNDYLQHHIDETSSVRTTMTNLLTNKLPVDNITNIINILNDMRKTNPFSYTFMIRAG